MQVPEEIQPAVNFIAECHNESIPNEKELALVASLPDDPALLKNYLLKKMAFNRAGMQVMMKINTAIIAAKDSIIEMTEGQLHDMHTARKNLLQFQIISDGDGHTYLVPDEMVDEFQQQLEDEGEDYSGDPDYVFKIEGGTLKFLCPVYDQESVQEQIWPIIQRIRGEKMNAAHG